MLAVESIWPGKTFPDVARHLAPQGEVPRPPRGSCAAAGTAAPPSRSRSGRFGEPIVSIETAGLRVLLVDIDTQARPGRPRMIEQASTDTPAAQPGFDEEHLDMRLVQANEALGHAVVVDQHPDLDGRQVQVANLWVKLDDVRFTEKSWVARTERSHRSTNAVLSASTRLRMCMLDSFIRKIPGRTKGSRDRQAGRHAEVRRLDARGANQRMDGAQRRRRGRKGAPS